MRKSTHSLYQPTQNKTFLNLEGSSLMGNKSSGIGSNKKIQGKDVMGGTRPNFQQTINKLKSKPNQKYLEDEYIKGLQQEIKYLEYELKLLKDKEIMEREGVNQLDNFLKDEIPINENILAMKNKYNATKNKLEDQFKQLSSKNLEAGDVLETQKNQIKRLHQIIEGHRKEVGNRNVQFKSKLSELVRLLTLVDEQTISLLENNKTTQDKIKKMNDEIANIQRRNQKQKIEEVRAIQQKSKTLQKFQQNSKKTKADMLEALQKVQQMEEYMKKGSNPLSDDLQQKNSVLRKRIMVNQKQKSTAENIIAEIELFLKQQERERQIQRRQKLKLTNAADQYRNELQNLERNSENMIKQQTLRTKKLIVKQMEHDFKDKEEIYQKLCDRLSDLQKNSSDLISEKKDLQMIIQSQESKEKTLQRKIKELYRQILQNKCTKQSLGRLSKQIQSQLTPLTFELGNYQNRIPIVAKEIDKKNTMIHHLNKQVELLKDLKGLDFDHLHMISSSGVQMQNTLNQFIKNWEKLKSS